MDSIIALLLGQNDNEQAALDSLALPTVTRNAPKRERKGKEAKTHPHEASEKAQVVKARTGEAIYGLSLPETRPLSVDSAKDFLRQMLHAGSKDKLNMRNEQIQAIAEFIGYDTQESFATQDNVARAKATAMLNPAKALKNFQTRGEERAMFQSFTGYVKGACDHNAKRLADLEGKEVALTDSIIEHDATVNDTSKSMTERTLAVSLVKLERERVAAVQNDIRAMKRDGVTFISPITGR